MSVWLLVDKVVIETDAYLHRETLELDLSTALEELHADVRSELAERYVKGTEATLKRLRDELQAELRPREIAPEPNFVPAQGVHP